MNSVSHNESSSLTAPKRPPFGHPQARIHAHRRPYRSIKRYPSQGTRISIVVERLRASKAAEKLDGRGKKCQGTTSVVPQIAENKGGLQRLRKNSTEEARSVRARLQSCRKCHRINVGFSPCGMLFKRFTQEQAFFRSLFSPWGRIPGFSSRATPFSAACLARTFQRFKRDGPAGRPWTRILL